MIGVHWLAPIPPKCNRCVQRRYRHIDSHSMILADLVGRVDAGGKLGVEVDTAEWHITEDSSATGARACAPWMIVSSTSIAEVDRVGRCVEIDAAQSSGVVSVAPDGAIWAQQRVRYL